MQLALPITRELLLVGGGHTHALVLKMWGMAPLPGVRVTVINPNPTAPYSGMLPGFVAGHYGRNELDIDLVRLARFANARLITGRAVHVDAKNQTVTLADGRILPYHIASIDVGITSDMPAMPGFSEFAIPAKPLDRFAQTWDAFRQGAHRGGPGRAAVIGGGVAGVELALAMAHALGKSGTKTRQVTLIDRSEIVPELQESRREFFRRHLAAQGVDLVEHSPIERISEGQVLLADGREIQADYVVGAAGARPHSWLAKGNLALENGFIKVRDTLQSVNFPDLFAVGDCAHLTHAPVPKAGVFAVREAPILFANLRAALTGGKMKSYHPQKDYLKLISLGRKSALADKWGRMFSGGPVWRLKNRIDVKFMDQFRRLKPMPAPKLPRQVANGVRDIVAGQPLCGGCGAKLGQTGLTQALAGLNTPPHPDVVQGIGDDAAILRGRGKGFQVISTDHLRSFTHDTGTMARIAAIHALGDIWAMGAEPQAALATVILPPLSPALQQSWLHDIMAEAAGIFSACGASIVGGHSSQGAELTIGFTLTGQTKGPPITKGGAQPGDILILTKPIGTGVILAAEMAMAAQGDWVVAALNSMARPQGDWAAALGTATAMSDVTGFGLAGHVMEIADASGVGVELDLNAVPLLPGAMALAQSGIRSSLFAANRARCETVNLPDAPRTDLLFDPQTAGGLLAAVPPDAFDATLARLQAAGNRPARIGQCTKGPAGLTIRPADG